MIYFFCIHHLGSFLIISDPKFNLTLEIGHLNRWPAEEKCGQSVLRSRGLSLFEKKLSILELQEQIGFLGVEGLGFDPQLDCRDSTL